MTILDYDWTGITLAVYVFKMFLVALSVYWLAGTTAEGTGPFGVFINIRTFVINKYADVPWLVEGISCFFCQSFWFSLIISYLVFGVWDFVLIGPAIVGLVSIIRVLVWK